MQRAWLDAGLVSVVRRQIGVKKTESVWHFDDPHPSRVLLFNNLIAQCLHSRPMHLRPEMMFRVITVKEPSPVVKLPVSAYAPRDRLVRITSVMPIVSVQIREAVAKVPERQKKTDVTPVENTEDNKVRDERRSSKTPQKASRGSLRFNSLKTVLGSSRKKLRKVYASGCSASPSCPCL